MEAIQFADIRIITPFNLPIGWLSLFQFSTIFSVEMLIAFRFVQAVGSCVAAVGVPAMVRDYFPAKATIYSILMLMRDGRDHYEWGDKADERDVQPYNFRVSISDHLDRLQSIGRGDFYQVDTG